MTKVPPHGFAKIQLLPLHIMFGPGGAWHARDEHELAGALAAHKEQLDKLANNPNVAEGFRRTLSHALAGVMYLGGRLSRKDALEVVPLLNSAAFRTGGSSTMKWSVWKTDAEQGLRIKPVPAASQGALAQQMGMPKADVYVALGKDLFTPLANVSREVAAATIGAIDQARLRHPNLSVEDLRKVAPAVAGERIFDPTGQKSLMKVDYKLFRSGGKIRAGLIDVSSELVGIGPTDELLGQTGTVSRLAKRLALGILKIHQDESGKIPSKAAIMVRDNKLYKEFAGDIESIRGHLEKLLKKKNPAAEVKVVLQELVQRRLKSTGNLKVQTADGKSIEPELLVRYGRFPLEREQDEKLKGRGVNVIDKSDYVLAADKTINSPVLSIYKTERESPLMIPRRVIGESSIFSGDYKTELDKVFERARVEGWPGVVIKLPTKLAAGKTGAEEVTAHFANPHSPLHADAVKQAISEVVARGHDLPAKERDKARLTYEELVPSELPELGGRGVEIRTLVMPSGRRRIQRVQHVLIPRE